MCECLPCAHAPVTPCTCVFFRYTVATNVSVSNEVVDVKLGENCTITCTATGDNVPSTTPWWHKGKLFNANDDDSITVNTVPLQDTIGVMSTITFDKLTEDQLNGSYICQAENENAAVTLVKAGRWNVKCQYVKNVPDTSFHQVYGESGYSVSLHGPLAKPLNWFQCLAGSRRYECDVMRDDPLPPQFEPNCR